MVKTTPKFSNNASSQITVGIGAGDTSISILPGSGLLFPPASPVDGTWFAATLFDSSNNIEIVHVTARSADNLTVLRGQEGTAARSWPANSTIEHRLTAAMLDAKADAQKPNLAGPVNISGDVTVTGSVAATAFAGDLVGNTQGTHTGPVVGNVTGDVSGTAANVTGVVALTNGGTGATTAEDARTALGLGALATQDTLDLAATTGVLALARGGTGSSTAADARVALGLGQLATQAQVNLFDQVTGVLGFHRGGTGMPDAIGYLKGTGISFEELSQIPAADVQGLAPSATTDTTNAANITSGVLNPARIGISAQESQTGYIVFPGGIRIQWGVVHTGTDSEGSTSVTFPVPFSSQCWVVLATTMNAPLSNSQDVYMQAAVPTTTGCVFYRQVKGSISHNISFYWLAIGK